MSSLSTTRMRLDRLGDERERTYEKIEDTLKLAEDEKRDLDELEQQHLAKYREQVAQLEEEINLLAADLERAEGSRDVSKLLRSNQQQMVPVEIDGGPVIYRTFAAYARDELIVRFPQIAAAASNSAGGIATLKEAATDRLSRAVAHTLTADVQGLLPPTHLAQIMDIINGSRPVVATGRSVPLTTGKLTYPKIVQRPEVLLQAAEKTEAGTKDMQVELDTITADTYLGGGNLSWQVINWSTPDALQLWFDLAAEAYARQTETAACSELGTAAGGTISPALGTTGTEDFNAWRAAVLKGISTIYANTGGRQNTNTLYLSAQRFFSLAGVGTNATLQVSAVGSLDVSAMTGTWSGLRVVGSYGFTNANTAIVGDSSAFLVGETPGAPVEMRAVEPAIGGMEVGVIGAFKSKVFDPTRFIHLS
jgi:HK97 family phage major capsid protein